jgi:hypothetical protein
MHNEELGLLKREISELYDSLDKETRSIVDSRLLSMPTVPNFPKISCTLENPSYFMAKDWIVVSKYICCAVHGKVIL